MMRPIKIWATRARIRLTRFFTSDRSRERARRIKDHQRRLRILQGQARISNEALCRNADRMENALREVGHR